MVLVDLVVNRAGQVENARIRRSFKPAFDTACIDAIRQWRFHPATQKGKPVAFDLTMHCEFNPQAQPIPPSDPS